MRTLSVVIVLEFVALIALVLVWSVTSQAESMVLGAGPAPAGERAAALLQSAATRQESVAPATAPVRRFAASDVPGAASVVVHGRLLAADGGAAPTDANVSFRRAGLWRSATTTGEGYATTGLAPGRWNVQAQADGFATYRGEHELDTSEVQVVDLTFASAQRVKVFLRTPDGASLHAALAKVFTLRGLHVVATTQAIAGDLPAVESTSVGDLEAGRYRSAYEADTKVGASDPDGELQLDRPAPVHATLLLRHLVLARQIVAPAQSELTFTLDAKEVLDRLTTVRLRVLDAVTGQPVSGAFAALESSQGGGARAKTDADGVAVSEQVPPGLSALQVNAKGYESLWTLVRVPAGGTLDLGDVTLHPPVPLRGRLLDGDGKPVSGSLQWTPLDTMTFPRELVNRRNTSTDGDGEYTLSLGKRRYVITARSSDGRVGVAIAEGGAPQACDVRMVTPVEVFLVAKGDPLVAYVATVRDHDGVPIAAVRIEPRWREQTLRVPPGDYTLEVHDDGDRLVHTQKLSARAAAITLEVSR